MTLGCNGLRNGQSRVISFVQMGLSGAADRRGGLFLCPPSPCPADPEGEQLSQPHPLGVESGQIDHQSESQAGPARGGRMQPCVLQESEEQSRIMWYVAILKKER